MRMLYYLIPVAFKNKYYKEFKQILSLTLALLNKLRCHTHF